MSGITPKKLLAVAVSVAVLYALILTAMSDLRYHPTFSPGSNATCFAIPEPQGVVAKRAVESGQGLLKFPCGVVFGDGGTYAEIRREALSPETLEKLGEHLNLSGFRCGQFAPAVRTYYRCSWKIPPETGESSKGAEADAEGEPGEREALKDGWYYFYTPACPSGQNTTGGARPRDSVSPPNLSLPAPEVNCGTEEGEQLCFRYNISQAPVWIRIEDGDVVERRPVNASGLRADE